MRLIKTIIIFYFSARGNTLPSNFDFGELDFPDYEEMLDNAEAVREQQIKNQDISKLTCNINFYIYLISDFKAIYFYL